MTYAKNSTVEAVDFNTLIGTTDTTNVNEFNAVWATGSGNRGYGQTPISQVAEGEVVSSTEWAALINAAEDAADHQGTAYTAVAVPVTGTIVEYSSALPVTITQSYQNRLNAASQGTTSVSTVVNSTTWNNALTFTHTVTFESGDKARYFFNCGGQLAITLSTPNGTRADQLFHDMAAAAGTIVMSGHTSGSITIANTSYTGITNISGGTVGVLAKNANLGYFALSTTDQVAFKQGSVSTLTGYVGSSILVSIKTNGTQGANGDNGNVITITTVWDENPNGITVQSGTTTAVTVRPPSTSKLSNSWGTVTVSGVVTGN